VKANTTHYILEGTMKRIILALILLPFAFPVFGQQARQLTVAVSPFDVRGGFDQNDADTIYEIFVSELVTSGKVKVVDRTSFDKITTEMRFQASDWSDSNKVAQLGRALNANSLIRGQLMNLRGQLIIMANILDINTAQILSSYRLQLNDVLDALDKMPEFVSGMVANLPGVSNTGGTPGGRSNAAQKEYNIGDFGPAGGIVFYDKGIFSNGWRYLEAASFETEVRAPWGAYQKNVQGTNTSLGTGKKNTEIIVAFLRQTGERNTAAQICDALVFDGFDDWFLPSKDELNLMYTNLKKNGIGNFQNALYWSSSQVNANYSWYQYFSDGSQYNDGKPYPGCVRAVRAF
jgi:TolB-like protein